MNFEKYLQDKHAKHYAGTDDDMPDAFDNWICDFDADDWLAYGNAYGSEIIKNRTVKITKVPGYQLGLNK